MRHIRFKRALALVLTVALALGLSGGALAAPAGEKAPTGGLTIEKLDSISANLMQGQQVETPEMQAPYADDEMVRVIITLKAPSVIEQMQAEGRNTTDLVKNRPALRYQAQLRKNQDNVASSISAQALRGKKLDVVWNLTLAANAMSANVPYGTIEAIKAVKGVVKVELARRYEPMEAHTTNIVAKDMTGANALQADPDYGYTGAGTRIAVIDTGTDTDHQSLDEEAFLYSLWRNAQDKGMEYEAYVESLNLLDKEEIALALPLLHAYEMYTKPVDGESRTLTADDLYYTAKLPFNFNYVDVNLDVTHDNDNQSSHGSHVAGIATANRYIPGNMGPEHDFNGDGVTDEADAQALMAYVVSGTAYANEEASSDVDGDGKVTTYDVSILLAGLKAASAEAVGVEGVAPDAQLITMKVFGNNGGAYTDDYCAALEDAVLLGCDVANLSLGSDAPDFSTIMDAEDGGFIAGVIANYAASRMVVAAAAGNNGNWADHDYAWNLLYTDEGGVGNMGSPSGWNSTLTVASVNNVGSVTTTNTLINDTVTVYPQDGTVYNEDGEDLTENFWADLGSPEGEEYDLVFLGDPTKLLVDKDNEAQVRTDDTVYGGKAGDFTPKSAFQDKIVLIARGNMVNFSDKHSFAGAAGARAVLIYNNEVGGGAPGASLLGTTSNVPCATISLEEAAQVFALAQRNSDGLYAVSATISSGLFVDRGEGKDMAMSSFSTWGSMGGLTIKPEITAPGGGIYSLNGIDPSGSAYEQMSGTSMATPHVSGATALVAQYIKENDLVAKTGLTQRVLGQSLMMSTAVPIMDANTDPKAEYSVRNQGAGLVNVSNVVKSESYVMVTGQPDGKVKAELGDGVAPYSFSFQVSNLTAAAQTYDLEASVLTSGWKDMSSYTGKDYDGKQVENKQYSYNLTTDEMRRLGADVTCRVDGSAVSSLTVPANGSVTVTVTIAVTDAAVAEMTAAGFVNGFYVEGYIYLKAAGDTRVDHSIPFLGWHGNWTDPSMFDKWSTLDYYRHIGIYTDEDDNAAIGVLSDPEDRPPHLNYMVTSSFTANYAWVENVWSYTPVGAGTGYYYNGNVYNNYYPLCEEEYLPQRNALNSTDERSWEFYAVFPSLIRSASAVRIRAYDPDTGEIYKEDEDLDWPMYASFYYANYGDFMDLTGQQGIGFLEDWDMTDSHGVPLAEGRKIAFELTVAPEYYRSVDAEGNVHYDWDALGHGAALSWTFTVDNTAPDLTDAEDALQVVTEDGKEYLTYKVQDNRYVAAVVLLDGAGTSPIAYDYPNQKVPGAVAEGRFELEDILTKKLTIAICDYAGNETYYAVNRNGEGTPYGQFLAFQYDINEGRYNNWAAFDLPEPAQGDHTPLIRETTVFSATGVDFACAEYVNGWVFAQTVDSSLYAIPVTDFYSSKTEPRMIFLTKLNEVYQDLAYNYSDGMLYGVYIRDDGTTFVNSINFRAGQGLDDYGDPREDAFMDLSCGIFSARVQGLTIAIDDEGVIYIMGPEVELDIDDNGDWVETVADTFSLWRTELEQEGSESYYTPLTKVADPKINSDYRQSMTFDHNTEKLYWVSFYEPRLFFTNAYLYEIGLPASAGAQYTFTKLGELSTETCALMAPLSAASEAKPEHTNVPSFDGSELGRPILRSGAITLLPGAKQKLFFDFSPWYTDHTDVVWSSANEEVCTVDAGGVVTGVGNGSTTVTVAAKDDPALFSTCAVNVTTMNAKIDGQVFTARYTLDIDEGVADMTITGNITDPQYNWDYGAAMSESTTGRDGYIYAVESDNNGIIYKIDPETGEVLRWFQPIDGDMVLGLGYSNKLDTFAAMMNYYLYMDIPLDDEQSYFDEMLESYDDESNEWTWHRLNMAGYLEQSNTDNFVTGENGYGSIVDVVFSAISCRDNTSAQSVHRVGDFLGNGAQEADYTPDVTWVLLDNVGRFWYIDEISGMTMTDDSYKKGDMVISADTPSMEVIETATGVYSVFIIRCLEETPLHAMYLNDIMPRYTYYYNDLYCTSAVVDVLDDQGQPTGQKLTRDIYFITVSPYWDNEPVSHFYLYIPGVTCNGVQTDGQFFELYVSDRGYFSCTLNYAELKGGLDLNVSGGATSSALWHAPQPQKLSDVYRRTR